MMHRFMIPLLVAAFVAQTLSSSSFADGAKMRVLALHGYNGNAAGLCQTFSSWDQSIMNLVEFNCLNGAFRDKYSDNAYSWLNMDSSRSKSRVDEGLAYVLDYMRKTGPYDGILGFSQGGIMAGLVTGVLSKKMVILGRKSGDLPPLRFAIIDEGGYIQGLLDEVYDPPLRTKSFHIIGNYDQIRQLGESFIPKWNNPRVMYLNMPHSYLTGNYMDDSFKWNLKNFLTSL